ncbi:hypothetical protein ACSSS7_000259 [Eimeria intestinalis]
MGIDESERIDQAASAASCSGGGGTEDGCIDRALGIGDRKHGPVSRRDCVKAACIECPQTVTAAPGVAGFPSDEALTSGLVYGATSAFPAISFSTNAEEAPCMHHVHEASQASLSAGGCPDPNTIGDPSLLAAGSPFFPEHSAASQQQQAVAAAAISLRAFPPQEACAVVGPGRVAFGPYCSEEASPSVYPGSPPPAGLPPLDLAASRGNNSVLGEHGCAGAAWPQWAQTCPSASDCDFPPAAALGRAVSERFAAPPTQSLRTTQPSHGGGQLQVSIVSPGSIAADVLSGEHQSPDHFVLCLEGESGQEQHVSIDRQELLLVASAEVHALAEQRDSIRTPTGSRTTATKGEGTMYEEGQQDAKGGGGGRYDKGSQDVGRWQHQMCKELELQKRRLQQREEACRQREEEFRLREDEARRQKLTIAALEGEVLKVTEEMQEMLLQKEEGRLIVQREFLAPGCDNHIRSD